MTTAFSFAFLAFVMWALIRLLAWGGPFPPRRGWSSRQKERMGRQQSPWTFQCWILYHFDRNSDIRHALKNCGEWK